MQRIRAAIPTLITLALLSSLSAGLLLSGIYLYLNPKLPSVEVLREAKLQIPLRIYSQNGELIGEYGEKFRTPVLSEQIPQHLINAILAAEDDRFLKHRGIDIAGLLRAAGELLSTGEIQSGGSTITMQVARNFFLSKERSFARKFNEILLSLKIERLLSKDEILELYVNKIYLGKRAYGIGAASAIYYGKDISELNLPQLAMIAGLPKAPSANNPINNPNRALARRNWILGRMRALEFIDEETWQAAIETPITASNHGPKLQLDARYAAEMARAFAIEQFGTDAYTDGLRIVTTVNGDYQRHAADAVVQGLHDYTRRHGYRGPEYRLHTLDLEGQLKELARLRVINDLQPALILAIEPAKNEAGEPSPQYLQVALAMDSDRRETLNWDMKNHRIRSFITEDRRSEATGDLRELLQAGDIIRVRYDDKNALQLAQLPAASASLVSLDPYNGAIRAIVGGYDFNISKFNRAAQAYRQPGSNFKPFIYAAAFSNGYTASSVINDAPIVFSDSELETDWRPENASGKFYGPTTLRRALYLSRNLVSVRLLRDLGIDKALEYLDRFEFSGGRMPRDLSLALGSYALTPLEVASLYSIIANGGYQTEPYIVEAIYDRNHKLLYKASPALACEDCVDVDSESIQANATASGMHEQAQEDEFIEAESLSDLFDEAARGLPPSETALVDDGDVESQPRLAERVMDERVAYILDNILQDVIKRGTATRARSLGRSDLAGKTGTTNGPTDAWFSGYHPELVTTTWLGFDDNQKLGRQEFGGSAALPIWMDYMEAVLPELPVARRVQPEGLLALKIDRLTGGAPTARTQETLFELFREEHAPDLSNPLHRTDQRPLESVLEEELF